MKSQVTDELRAWQAAIPYRGDQLSFCLTKKCRCLTISQCARLLGVSEAEVKRKVKKLEAKGFAKSYQMMIHPEISLSGPVLDWALGQEGLPDFGALSWALKSRWKMPPKQMQIVTATKEAKKFIGGCCGGRKPRVREVSHDIHVSSVYLWYRERDAECDRLWESEDTFMSWGCLETARVPDAIYFADSGFVEDGTIIDFGGSYSKQKLEAMHDEYSRICRYQIW
jgi:DNA-binding Lrp family transcriptional regulator